MSEVNQKPVAWLVPELQTFKDADRVHFTRAPGCTMTDAELIENMEGRVIWVAKTFSDSPGVTDKFGVEHKPKPLFTELQPAPAPLSDDTKRIDWMDKDAGERVIHLGANWYTRPNYGQPYRKHKNLRAAIDAALAAKDGK